MNEGVPVFIDTTSELAVRATDIEAVRLDRDGNELVVRFSKSGKEKFHRLTGKNVNKQIAYLIDKTIVLIPTINSAVSAQVLRIEIGPQTAEVSFAIAAASCGEIALQYYDP